MLAAKTAQPSGFSALSLQFLHFILPCSRQSIEKGKQSAAAFIAPLGPSLLARPIYRQYICFQSCCPKEQAKLNSQWPWFVESCNYYIHCTTLHFKILAFINHSLFMYRFKVDHLILKVEENLFCIL